MSTPAEMIPPIESGPKPSGANPAVNDHLGSMANMEGPYQDQLEQDQASLQGVNEDISNIPQFQQQAPQLNSNGLMATAPMLIALAALGGHAAGLSAKTMLSATNAMMKGTIQGNRQQYADAKAQYDDNYAKYIDKYKQQLSIYNEMRQVYKGRVDADLRALEIARRATGDMSKIDQNGVKNWHWEQDFNEKLMEAQRKQMESEARVRELESQSHLNEAHADHVGEADAAKKAEAAKSRGDISEEIDALIKQIQANPTATGLTGYVRRAGEVAGTATGLTDQTPANDLQASVNALLLKLPKALTGTSKSAKDERARVDAIANSLSAGSTGTIAVNKLKQLKSILDGPAPPDTDEKPGATPPATPPGQGGSAKTIVRRGKTKDGKHDVVQYSDGTIEQLN